jgi:hypothetical protein
VARHFRIPTAAWPLAAALTLGLCLAGGCGDDENGSQFNTCDGAPCPPSSGTGSGSGSGGAGGDGESNGSGQAAFNPGFGGNGGSGGNECPDIQIQLAPQIPTVVVLIDRSGSMDADLDGTNPPVTTEARWFVVHDALVGPSGVVSAKQGAVQFGVTLYNSNGGTAGGTCPILVETAPTFGAAADVALAMTDNQPSGDTPTGESLEAVADALAALPDIGPKVIILATDGEPDTCAVPNPQNGQPESIAAAQYAFGLGIPTYIVSVGADISATHLQDLANAGQGLAVGGGTNADYYLALNPQQLVTDLDTILDSIVPCTFAINGNIDPAFAPEGKVFLDGQSLPYLHPDGWKLNGTNEIELTGASCDKLQQGSHDVTGTFPCAALPE